MRQLYASTREEEMKQFPFDDAQKQEFLDQQFGAQFEHYRLHYPTCERNIIERTGSPSAASGSTSGAIRSASSTSLSCPSGAAAASARMLVRDVLDRGARAGKPVTIHVEGFNPALRLYERLGFQKVDTNGVYYLMRWEPPAIT